MGHRTLRATARAAGLALLMSVAHGAPPAGAATATITLPERRRAADFRLASLNGGTLDLAELRARGPVVVDFWATWCKPCLMALPELNRLHERNAARGLTVVGVSVDGPRNFSKVRSFANRLRLGFPVAIDRDESLQQLYQVKAFPTTFLIAPDGRIAWTRQGYLPGDGEALARAVEALLDTTAVDTIP